MNRFWQLASAPSGAKIEPFRAIDKYIYSITLRTVPSGDTDTGCHTISAADPMTLFNTFTDPHQDIYRKLQDASKSPDALLSFSIGKYEDGNWISWVRHYSRESFGSIWMINDGLGTLFKEYAHLHDECPDNNYKTEYSTMLLLNIYGSMWVSSYHNGNILLDVIFAIAISLDIDQNGSIISGLHDRGFPAAFIKRIVVRASANLYQENKQSLLEDHDTSSNSYRFVLYERLLVNYNIKIMQLVNIPLTDRADILMASVHEWHENSEACAYIKKSIIDEHIYRNIPDRVFPFKLLLTILEIRPDNVWEKFISKYLYNDGINVRRMQILKDILHIDYRKHLGLTKFMRYRFKSVFNRRS